jgi:hypothetical protein
VSALYWVVQLLVDDHCSTKRRQSGTGRVGMDWDLFEHDYEDSGHNGFYWGTKISSYVWRALRWRLAGPGVRALLACVMRPI